jgi:hypothetical protein
MSICGIVIPVKTGIQDCPCENREPVSKKHGFPASSAGQALLPLPSASAEGMTTRRMIIGKVDFKPTICLRTPRLQGEGSLVKRGVKGDLKAIFWIIQ